MPMETYRVEIRANDETNDVVAELYNDNGVIEATERASYASSAPWEERAPDTLTREFTADTTVLDVQITSFEEGFEVRVVGDEGDLFVDRFPDET